ncbi:hypothetical protein QQF64_036380 [Cirrhinus molitorella]|uniref:MADF domain-containing protein n=1 Tax=Cirrhinus molitorella TaxID=172907 RepID=A0ABR3NIS4_9TELE
MSRGLQYMSHPHHPTQSKFEFSNMSRDLQYMSHIPQTLPPTSEELTNQELGKTTEEERRRWLRRAWTIEKEDKLAELWQEQRALYDVSSSVYHDRVVRDDILQRIAQELQLSGEP